MMSARPAVCVLRYSYIRVWPCLRFALLSAVACADPMCTDDRDSSKRVRVRLRMRACVRVVELAFTERAGLRGGQAPQA
jgi:hypothetical protein